MNPGRSCASGVLSIRFKKSNQLWFQSGKVLAGVTTGYELVVVL